MKKLCVIIAVCLIVITSACSDSSEISKIKEVATRVAPWMEGKIITKEIPPLNGNDVFEISTKKGKLVIKASSMPAAGMAFNHYLKYYCKRHYALIGTNLAPVEQLPEIDGVVTRECPFEHRHIFNFCIQSYSTAFYNWEEWEIMIDYMVLMGVNIATVPIGQEKVWYNTLKKFNYTHEEILDFLPGPAFGAWHMMANLEGWGGPITPRFIDYRSDLAKQIFDRMRKYDISPIYTAFYGMVPSTLAKKYPDANIIAQGKWVGNFTRPSVLVPTDPLYDEMAEVYYTELKKLYGEFNYFGGEPFHEGGIRGDVDESDLAVKVLSTFRKYNEGAVWMLQGWSGNPTAKFLSKIDKEKDVLVWDFRGELWAEWERTKGYQGASYLWGIINNAGDTPGLFGRLERFNRELFRAKNSPEYGKNMKGLNVGPEGIINNPVTFDFLHELVWNNDTIDVANWINDYSVYRYGKENTDMKRAWEILFATAYSSEELQLIDPVSKTLPPLSSNGESLLAASPIIDLRTCSAWGTSEVAYDWQKMKDIIPYLIGAIDELKGVNSFEVDVVDFTRQLISNDFRACYKIANEAIKNKDLKTLERCSEKMLSLITDMDNILSTNYDFMLGRWVNMAKDLGETQSEKDLFEFNAKSIITYWGKDYAGTDLRDYAYKEWGGLVREVHYPRWKSFLEYHINTLKGEPATSINNTQFAIDWAKKNTEYSRVPEKEFASTLKRVLNNLKENIE